ncbi:MAG: sigma-70 family RNA polymerase sigma factor [Candidatus Choladocola sp.]|nr:sigma-70 family RNA polymerase sigma factor [Candidatus Choladocola sp.]
MHILVKKAQKGDPESFVQLIESCKNSMYKVARGYFDCEDDVADAMAETVALAWEHLGELKKAEYFKTWLIRILINTCNRMVRNRKKCEVTELVPELQYLDNRFSDVEFREMLSSFPEDCRMILLLYYGEQFHTREIAEILGMKENTVKSKLRRTRGTLRESILCSF